jgi:acetylglutamate kinase
VKDAYGQVVSRLRLEEIAALRASGAVSGGMLPKLDACERALKAGVGSVRILQAAKVESLKAMFEVPLEHGTELVAHA